MYADDNMIYFSVMTLCVNHCSPGPETQKEMHMKEVRKGNLSMETSYLAIILNVEKKADQY